MGIFFGSAAHYLRSSHGHRQKTRFGSYFSRRYDFYLVFDLAYSKSRSCIRKPAPNGSGLQVPYQPTQSPPCLQSPSLLLTTIFRWRTMNRNKQAYKSANRKDLLTEILLAGLFAGVLDGIAATIQTAFLGSSNPIRVFNYVASGVFGDAALSGGGSMTLLGILFHLAIATTWAAIYFFIYPVIQKFSRQWILSGLVYGAFVWACMNLIVVPLSNIPPRTFTVSGVTVGMLIIIVFVGMPIAYLANRFYSQNNK